jgi:hypothetical protein
VQVIVTASAIPLSNITPSDIIAKISPVGRNMRNLPPLLL